VKRQLPDETAETVDGTTVVKTYVALVRAGASKLAAATDTAPQRGMMKASTNETDNSKASIPLNVDNGIVTREPKIPAGPGCEVVDYPEDRDEKRHDRSENCDPSFAALDTTVLSFLATENITTPAELSAGSTPELGQAFIDWKSAHTMIKELKLSSATEYVRRWKNTVKNETKQDSGSGGEHRQGIDRTTSNRPVAPEAKVSSTAGQTASVVVFVDSKRTEYESSNDTADVETTRPRANESMVTPYDGIDSDGGSDENWDVAEKGKATVSLVGSKRNECEGSDTDDHREDKRSRTNTDTDPADGGDTESVASTNGLGRWAIDMFYI